MANSKNSLKSKFFSGVKKAYLDQLHRAIINKSSLISKDTALEEISTCGDSSSIPYLNKALQDKDKDTRRKAAIALKNLARRGVGNRSSIQYLNNTLEDKDAYIRSEVAYALASLAKIGVLDSSSISLLVKILKIRDYSFLGDFDEQKNAASALAEFVIQGVGNRSYIISELNCSLRYTKKNTKSSIIEILGNLAECGLGDSSSISFLNDALKDKNKNVKLSAVETLAKFARNGIADESSLLPLSKLLQDKNEKVRFQAEKTIEIIKKFLKNNEYSTIRCPQCGFENPSDADFCGNCGEPLNDRTQVY